ncbi:hypothetical protein HMPREF9057_01646 [Actinomyces sp. oral taxon 171 str. F0337]|nr:hypothetical protein HMPREF9057_01646 [Actinomyces sp. oral taxon 171 str. F0337]
MPARVAHAPDLLSGDLCPPHRGRSLCRLIETGANDDGFIFHAMSAREKFLRRK